jgi:hypothetical protein
MNPSGIKTPAHREFPESNLGGFPELQSVPVRLTMEIMKKLLL